MVGYRLRKSDSELDLERQPRDAANLERMEKSTAHRTLDGDENGMGSLQVQD